MLEFISCDSLGDLNNGASRAIIDAAFREAVFDLEDRAHQDGKTRQVVITATLKRLDNGEVAAHVEAMAKVPKRRTAATIAAIRLREGVPSLAFNVDAPDDPKQRTIDEVGNEGAKG